MISAILFTAMTLVQTQKSLPQSVPAANWNFLHPPLSDPLPEPLLTSRQAPDLLARQNQTLPSGIPDRFNEGIFTAKEQMHDQQIDNLTVRTEGLESRANWMSGAIWAIGIFLVLFAGFIKLFWKGLAKALFFEIEPRIISKPN